MTNVKIEKYVDGLNETSFRVPAFVLGIARTLLPAAALNALAGRGFPVRELLDARARGIPYSATFNVREHGICKQIAVSLIAPRRAAH